MSTLQNEAAPVIDSVNNPRHPFGLPLGTIRGTMSLLICAFFWAALLWPDPTPPKPLLAHYFMLALVLLVFSPYSKESGDEVGSRFVPRLMRVLAIGGSLAVLGVVAASHPERLNARLTPDPTEVKDWWGVFLATVACGFAVGNIVRLILGRNNPVFQTLRAWLSVVGLLMMGAELVMWVSFATADNKQDEFLRFWQAFEMAFVSCYFGTRA